MKRIVLCLVCLLLVLPLGAFAQETVGLPNPMTQTTPESLLAEYGYEFVAPAQAFETVYFVIDQGEGQSPIGEMQFSMDGVDCFYRMQKRAEMEDISGVTGDFGEAVSLDLGTALGAMRFDASGKGVAVFQDVDRGLVYSVCVTADSNEETLREVCRTLYQPESTDAALVKTLEADDATMALLNVFNDFLTESGSAYNPGDDNQYWAIIARGANACIPYFGEEGNLWNKSGDRYEIRREVAEELGYACFAERNQAMTVEIPAEMTDMIAYDAANDRFSVQMGESGDVRTELRSVTAGENGSLIVRADFLSGEDELLGSYRYTLVPNPVADISVFAYSILAAEPA